jgi:antitoxin (DNA-binding transcriptional repressor) of toxin-antitoxin stability system
MTRTIDLQTTSASVDELLALLDQDTDILLMRGQTPVARLTPVATPLTSTTRVPGLHTGTTWVSDDFDDPLPDELWLGS